MRSFGTPNFFDRTAGDATMKHACYYKQYVNFSYISSRIQGMSVPAMSFQSVTRGMARLQHASRSVKLR